MPSGGSRPGAGRPRGSISSKRLRTEIATIQRDISSRRFKTALEFAMSVINDPNADMNDKIRLAIAAMPFQHPKLAELPAGKKDTAVAAAERAGTGRYAAAAVPLKMIQGTKP